MKSLAQYLAINRIKQQFWPKLLSAELVSKEDAVYVHTKHKGDKRVRKAPSQKQATNEDAIIEVEFKASLALPLPEQYLTYVAADMLVEGYVIVEIEGGWLIHGGEDTYQIHDDECSCGDFVYRRNQASPCKHLVFRDWSLNYRARSNRIRRNLNN